MKSIVEEGSSIFKAIEKGWTRAGNPSQFTVKIFELPEKNFFGMTTKQAKIGIMFEHDVDQQKGTSNRSSHAQKRNNPKQSSHKKTHGYSDGHSTEKESIEHQEKNLKQRVERVDRQKAVQQAGEQQHKKNESRNTDFRNKDREKKSRPVVEKESPQVHDTASVSQSSGGDASPKAIWTDDLITIAQGIVKESLTMLGFPNIEFSSHVENVVLKITFNAPILDNQLKEKQFFQHYAFLLMALLKNQSQSNTRSLRLFLASER